MSAPTPSPVAKKLGIKPGARVLVLRAETTIEDVLAPLPDGASRVSRAPADVVLLFARDGKALARDAPKAIAALAPGGLLWVAYPKITSKVPTDLTRDRGWEPVTSHGFAPVSLVALDGTWSAMRYKRDEGGALAAERRARATARQKPDAASPRPSVTTPPDLERALDDQAGARATWDALAPSHRREYAEWITSAKRDETRARRVAASVAKLASGKKRPS